MYRVYVRVSTDKDEQLSSVPNQIDVCRYWLETNGFEWNEDSVLKDEGISGTVLLERPAMQLLLELARKKEIEMVVFKSLNRLARDTKDALEIREVLSSHNVRIISVEEGYDSFKVSRNDMSYEMSSLFAEQYSRMLSVNVSGVLAAKVRRGEHIGRTPFGFDLIDKKLYVNKEESPVIEKIFRLYNQGWGYKRIAQQLNDDVRDGIGLKPQRSDTWQITTIQRIIKNPIYCGDFILNQYRTEKVAGRKKQIRNPEEKWILFKDHHPGIVSREAWEKANNKKVVNRKRKVTAWNEFRGVATCSECGSNMVIIQSWREKANGSKTHWKYLKCSKYRRAGADGCVNHVPITYEDFRESILEQLLAESKGMTHDFNNDFEDKKQLQLKALENKIAQANSKKKDLLDLYLEKVINKEEFEDKRMELEQNIRQWEEEVFVIRRKEHSQKHVHNIIEAFQLLEDQEQDLYTAFCTLIEEIKVHPDGTVDIKYTFKNE